MALEDRTDEELESLEEDLRRQLYVNEFNDVFAQYVANKARLDGQLHEVLNEKKRRSLLH